MEVRLPIRIQLLYLENTGEAQTLEIPLAPSAVILYHCGFKCPRSKVERLLHPLRQYCQYAIQIPGTDLARFEMNNVFQRKTGPLGGFIRVFKGGLQTAKNDFSKRNPLARHDCSIKLI